MGVKANRFVRQRLPFNPLNSCRLNWRAEDQEKAEQLLPFCMRTRPPQIIFPIIYLLAMRVLLGEIAKEEEWFASDFARFQRDFG